MNIDWSNRKQVINLAQDKANRDKPQIVYKVDVRTNYNICCAESWLRRLAEMDKQGMTVEFVLTVEPAQPTTSPPIAPNP